MKLKLHSGRQVRICSQGKFVKYRFVQVLLCVVAVSQALPAFGQALTLPDVRNHIFHSASATYGFIGNSGVVLPSDGETKKSMPNEPLTATKLFEIPASYTGPNGSNTGFVRASAFGALGTVGVIATATGQGADFLQAASSATAFTADELTFFSSGHTRLRVRTPIKLSGSIQANRSEFYGKASASYRAVAEALPDTGGRFVVAQEKSLGLNPAQDRATNMVLEMDVIAGRRVFVSLSIDAHAFSETQFVCFCSPVERGFGLGSVLLGNTLAWGGVESVVDLDTGEPVLNWSVTSESGADYSRSFEVPEPTTGPLLLGALIGWAGRRRRRLVRH